MNRRTPRQCRREHGTTHADGHTVANVIHFDPLQERLLRTDAFRRHSYVRQVRRQYEAWEAGRVALDGLCAAAGDALRAYASEVLDALLSAAGESHRTELVDWVRDAYYQSIGNAGRAIREAIADSTVRYAVAQRLQEQMLHAESQLRLRLASHPAGRPPS